MTHEDQQKYYKAKLESGMIYQDFVVDTCWTLLGLAVVQYGSKVYQQTVGESRTGVEIKHDEMYAKTGNLFIEVAEKARKRGGDYWPSGIERSDNTWLYLIGNYDTIFIFSKSFLKALYRSNKYRVFNIQMGTSRGFLLPHDDAEKYAAQILFPRAEKKVAKVVADLHELGNQLKDICLEPRKKDQLHLFSGGD